MSTSPAPARIPSQIWVLVAAAFSVAVGFGLVAPVLPQYAASFGVSTAAASFIVSAFALMRLLFAPAGGALVGRIGERRVYLYGLLIVALSTGACAFAGSYPVLLACRALGGIGSTMFTVSAMGLVVRLSPPLMRGRVSSLYAGAFLIGNIAGPVIGAAAAGLGPRLPFIVYAVMLLIAAGLVAVFLSGASIAPKVGSSPLPPMRVGEALSHPAYRSVLVSGFGNGWANLGVRVALLPLFAATVPGMGVGWAGIALAVFAAGNALTLTVAGRAVDARGRKPLMLVGLAVGGVATACLGFAHTVPVLLTASFVAGVGAGMFNPAQQAVVADVVGRERSAGKVLATFQMAQDLGSVIGPILAGAIVDHLGYGWAFGVTGAMLLLGIPAWLPAPETRPRLGGGDAGAADSDADRGAAVADGDADAGAAGGSAGGNR